MQVDLRESWWIRDVEIPTRLVLAPMAGVSVQAFRRQGRRYGAGLVCSEMVSCAGLEHRNERTLGYLRVGRDEHPLAIQIFGSEPAVMAEAAAMVVAAGADIVDINFGCPVRKVTKTGAGATLLEDPERACAIVDAVATAARVPVSVKMRRGLENGSRTCLEIGPRLVEAGAATLTLHPRSARQMYTGEADHSLTAELVQLVDVPVIASGDITSRARAQTVLATTGAAAVMVGRGAQGNPWALREIVDGDAPEPSREEVAAELIVFVRETVRELGERRASSFLKKFYGWYLGRGPLPEAVQAGARAARVDRGGRHAPARRGAARGGARRATRARAAGSGRRDPARLDADLDLRRRLAASGLCRRGRCARGSCRPCPSPALNRCRRPGWPAAAETQAAASRPAEPVR
jgi:tRNA-dihydrouridine synthase B